MLVKCNSFWSYLIGEPESTIEIVKNLLTLSEYDYQSEQTVNISYYVEEPDVLNQKRLKFPTGLCKYLLNKLHLDFEEQEFIAKKYSVDDIKVLCNEIHSMNDKFEVRDYQIESVLTSVNQFQSLILASVASGKTSMMSIVVRLLKDDKILVVNDNGFILNQIKDRFISMGVDPNEISMDINNLSTRICILTTDIIYSHLKRSDSNLISYLKSINTFIIDEAQHLQSVSSFSPLLYTDPANFKRVIGYSGSPLEIINILIKILWISLQ